MHRDKQAFTLVELSIVLVILGLLVGGVLAGQSLIHAAELRAISTEFTNYKTAMNAFKEKYFYLPGDMPNAVRMWGVAAGSGTDGVLDATCHNAVSTDTKTCNGDGNGKLSSAGEMRHFWKQLANAGLIEGTYSGAADPDIGPNSPGVNLPKSRYSGGGWLMQYTDGTGGTTYVVAKSYGNLLTVSAFSSGYMNSLLLTPQDAWNIDSKMDDGKPQTGIVSPLFNAATSQTMFGNKCTVATDDAYDLAKSVPVCLAAFQTGY